jgi:hypothetical protein
MAKPQLPSLSDEEQDMIASLCEDALFAAWNEDSAVEDINYKLRQLWETALRIGLAHGQEEAKIVCRKEDHLARATVAKQMEQERVWGYDVGWKLCSEVLQDRAQKASTTQSSTPSRSLSVAATQTEPVVHRSVSLSSSEEARANFKDMVQHSHLYDAPLFAALGCFILEDNSVLRCVAYQCRPQFPAIQYIIPALGAITDISFDFVDSGYARNPSRPNWMDLQLRTRTSHISYLCFLLNSNPFCQILGISQKNGLEGLRTVARDNDGQPKLGN